MTDIETIIAGLKNACKGHIVEIPWPHRILHEAFDALESLQKRVVELEQKNSRLEAVVRAAKCVTQFWVPQWEHDVDRGDADEALEDALAALDNAKE